MPTKTEEEMHRAFRPDSVWLHLDKGDPKETARGILSLMGKRYALELGMCLTFIAPNGPEILDDMKFSWSEVDDG